MFGALKKAFIEEDTSNLAESILGKPLEPVENIEQQNLNIERKIFNSSYDIDVNAIVGDIKSVEDIFNEKNVNTKTDNIYNVLKFDKTLPNTLPAELRKTTLRNIVEAAGLNIENLIADFDLKVKVLQDYTAEFLAESDKNVRLLDDDIEVLKNSIYEKEQKISEISKLSILMDSQNTTEIANLEKIKNSIS